MLNRIKIIDQPMGTGKTTGIIQYIKSNPRQKYMFVTPFLDECTRIEKDCEEMDFVQPNDRHTKISSLKELVREGKNICTSHELLKHFDNGVIALIEENEYVLILDEVVDVLDIIGITKADFEILMSGEFIDIEEGGTIQWKQKEYKGKLEEYKRYAETRQLKYFNKALLWELNSDIFNCFVDAIVLTYRFENSLMANYLRIYEIEYCYMSVTIDGTLHMGIYDDSEFRQQAKELIDVYEGKINQVGDSRNGLSVSWYKTKKQEKRKKRSQDLKKLKNNIYNYYRNVTKTSSFNMWTTFKDFRNILESPKCAKGFVACNCRATNQYKNMKALAYPINIFVNPIITNYFGEKSIPINHEEYALSQLLQWIWRSRIREGQPIQIYIPSKRMRDLLYEYLDGHR